MHKHILHLLIIITAVNSSYSAAPNQIGNEKSEPSTPSSVLVAAALGIQGPQPTFSLTDLANQKNVCISPWCACRN